MGKGFCDFYQLCFMLDEDMLDIALECELAFYLKATGQA